MSSRSSDARGKARITAWMFVAMLAHGLAVAADLNVCIDEANPGSAIDLRVARAAAQAEGYRLKIVSFSGYGKGGDGLPLGRFAKMARTECQLIMGFPLDVSTPHLPPDVEATSAYASTGFVLIRRARSTQMTLGELPWGTEVGIAQLDTYAGLLFAAHPNMVMHAYPKDSLMLADLAAKRITAALAWQPYTASYETTASSTLRVARLPGDHMLYNLVALYAPESQGAAHVFEKGLYELQSEQRLRRLIEPFGPAVATTAKRTTAVFDSTWPAAHLQEAVLRDATARHAIEVADRNARAPKRHGKPPALYTTDQATNGALAYNNNCSMCHGPALEGQAAGYAGPALKGADFADPSYDLHVSDIFNFVSKLMPADQPGRLSHEEDVQVMAFILQQNGYPPGSEELVYEQAEQSKVPIRYYGKAAQ